MNIKWHHIAISVIDMDKTKHFYKDLLEFEIDWERPEYTGDAFSNVIGLPDARAHVVMLKGYNTRIELFRYISPEGIETGTKRQCDFGMTHFAFTVKGIHGIYESLVKKGVRFNCPPQNLRPGVWATYMRDPEGNTIELVEYE